MPHNEGGRAIVGHLDHANHAPRHRAPPALRRFRAFAYGYFHPHPHPEAKAPSSRENDQKNTCRCLCSDRARQGSPSRRKCNEALREEIYVLTAQLPSEV